MKQTVVAKKYEMDPTALNRALNGRYKVIPTMTAIKLAKVLDMPVEAVVGAPATQLKQRFYELHEWGSNGKEDRER